MITVTDSDGDKCNLTTAQANFLFDAEAGDRLETETLCFTRLPRGFAVSTTSPDASLREDTVSIFLWDIEAAMLQELNHGN